MGKGKIWANKWSKAGLFRLEEVKFFCTFELFSQGLPLPPTQETNTEPGLFQRAFSGSKLAEEDGLRELGPVWEETAGEEAEETARRRGPEQRQEAKWKGYGNADLLPTQKGLFPMSLKGNSLPIFLFI